ncbi:MbnP family protein [Mucilaginibacter sabulilitoris]|uniref:MbnP family protein n=1 Tax=Mucilaginibacter sabulilitoris TaxID=1173583 RepID=A0ABZ0TFI9_9SPHI|nr:MbnP family protein [Mucilaginibacter sabulilitoris]WPU91753.1 MbnP family protein [Mucilaginibacter sabulilitoris]
MKNNMKKLLPLLLLSAIAFATTANSKIDDPKKNIKTGSLSVHFVNLINGRDLKLNDTVSLYKNANGDDFKVTTFKYYISNVSLIEKNGGKVIVPDSYFLINAADSSTLIQKITNIPEGKYVGMTFTIGVDSLRNFAGAQSGALDPAKGMFWTWNSGYIFVKLEGESTKSTAKKNRLTFHIGGAKDPDNTIRTFTQKFPNTLRISDGKLPELELVANAGALFQGKTTVDFAKLNFTMGGPNSVVVADNYANGLFKIIKVRN